MKPVTDAQGITSFVPVMGDRIEFSAIPDLTYKGRVWRGRVDLTDPDRIDFVLHHPAYGLDFIGIEEDHTVSLDPDEIIEARSDGMYYCSVCDVVAKNAQGMSGHKRSAVHKQNVADANNTFASKVLTSKQESNLARATLGI